MRCVSGSVTLILILPGGAPSFALDHEPLTPVTCRSTRVVMANQALVDSVFKDGDPVSQRITFP